MVEIEDDFICSIIQQIFEYLTATLCQVLSHVLGSPVVNLKAYRPGKDTVQKLWHEVWNLCPRRELENADGSQIHDAGKTECRASQSV